MGTFAGFYGEQKIKEKVKEEYISNLKKVLEHGGMMQFEKVNLFGEEIALLKELTPNENGYITFHYNYFGDEAWETAGINLNTCKFYSNKIGWSEFCDVILAAYVLTEFYTEEFGIAEINGDIFDAKEIIGWLNYVLDKKFTNIRAIDAFKILETCPELYRDDIQDVVQNCGCEEAISLSSLITYLYFKRHDNSSWDEIIKALGENTTGDIRPTDVILKMEKAIKRLKDEGKTYEDMLDLTFDIENYIRSKEVKEREKDESNEYKFSIVGLFCPKINILIQLCEIYEKDFWEEYKKYKDRLTSSADELWKGDSSKLKPIEKISTAEYLDTPDSALCFMHSEAKENYHKSDDDFILFWNEKCDLNFSEEFNQWCFKLQQDFDEIKRNIEIKPVQDFIKSLIFSLNFANKRYHRIYAHTNMFYDFLANAEKKEFQAALKLFSKIIDENYEEGKVIEDVRDWDIADKNKTFNKGRLNVKRYLAIMANKEFRNKIFGF